MFRRHFVQEIISCRGSVTDDDINERTWTNLVPQISLSLSFLFSSFSTLAIEYLRRDRNPKNVRRERMRFDFTSMSYFYIRGESANVNGNSR